ncbi:MAG TPA: ATP-binding protein [Pyrinomonadaceae bacterium]|jgi:hypothetical protein
MSERPDWHEANQRYLRAALAVVRELLEQHAAAGRGAGEVGALEEAAPDSAASLALREAARDMPAPPALDALCHCFGLTRFERDVLLLCAGVELDSSFAALCEAAQGEGARRASPTFSLALDALPCAHWNALAPTAALRRWRLIELGGGDSLLTAPLRVDERVLHYLVGVQHLDERLAGVVEVESRRPALVPSQQRLAERLAALWGARGEDDPRIMSVVRLCGADAASRRAIAAAACQLLGMNMAVMSAPAVPTLPAELDALTRLWEREAALGSFALLLDCEGAEAPDSAGARSAAYLVEHLNSPLIIAGRERGRAGSHARPIFTFDVERPGTSEQRELWREALGAPAEALNGEVEAVLSQFDLGAQAIRAAGAETLRRLAEPEGEGAPGLAGLLWDACRVQARHGLGELAQRLEPAAAWDDLVLPEAQRQILREVVAHVRHRSLVYDGWGFAAKGRRGLGISALFVGASGTGKTMAAEVLAGELRLDLYRIDLSSVVSKYIGETEKNLRRVFDAAEEGGAILLFDEADALFGKRSEVKDSHDRYANIEVSYLLQRMEAYRGLAILTTNLRSALDTAFLRRIRFVVPFPFPDAAQRAEIWRRCFPAGAPTEGLDFDRLSKLNVPGGNIRNIALHAAFNAADEGTPVCMSHLLRAARQEYAKIDKPLTDAETGGWT